jgi:hypothetical protein
LNGDYGDVSDYLARIVPIATCSGGDYFVLDPVT